MFMAFENENEKKKGDKEKKDSLDFDFNLPDLGLDSPVPTPPQAPSLAPPTIHAPMKPPTHSISSASMIPSQPVSAISSGPSQHEYDALLSQIRDKDGTVVQLKNQINDLNNQLSNLNSMLIERDNQINQLKGELDNTKEATSNYQNQLTQLSSQLGELQGQSSTLQSQIDQLQLQNASLQQQLGPLQSENARLQQENAYKEKRIQELKEPQAVMASTLTQQPSVSGSKSYRSTPSYTPPSTPSVSSAPIPSPSSSPMPSLGGGRRQCPNCGASGFSIKEVEDRTKIVSYIPKPIYGRKNICQKCGYEF